MQMVQFTERKSVILKQTKSQLNILRLYSFSQIVHNKFLSQVRNKKKQNKKNQQQQKTLTFKQI